LSVTEEIKARVDILDLIGSYNVAIKRAGRVYKACCPFHNERTPSFVVYPESGTWRCFGACAEGGDAFSFVMKQEGVDFKGALEILAGRTGVELKPQTSEQKLRDAELDKLRGLLNETAQFFYERLCEAADGEAAREYVRGRGLTGPTVDRFRIGYAPQGWQEAIQHLTNLGYSEGEILQAGVATKNEKGRVYDRFRNRLIIPIRDARGAVVGFGARALDPEDTPKYLNSPQTPLFDKSHLLFAFDAARRAIRESESAIIVEGYMDALQAHQAGFTNVVAQMGTALTEVQLKQLAKYAKKLIIALDPDEAGVNATLRGLNIARATLGEYRPVFDGAGVLRQSSRMDVDLRVMTLPEGQDPDDLIRTEPEQWTALVANAQPIVDYVIDRGTAQVTAGTPLADREAIARGLLPMLLENEPHRHHSVQRLALRLRINDRDLLSLAQRQQAQAAPLPASARQQTSLAKRVIQSEPPPTETSTALDTYSAMEGFTLSFLARRPEFYSVVNRRFAEVAADRDSLLGPLGPDDFERSEHKAVMSVFLNAVQQFEYDPLEFINDNLPADLRAELTRLLEGPLATLTDRKGWEAAEIAAWAQEGRRAAIQVRQQIRQEDPELTQFMIKTLVLRRRRIKRESEELGFLQQEEPEQALRYQREISRRYRIIRLLDSAVQTLQQSH